MIKSVDKLDIETVAKYAYELNLKPQHKCKAFPSEYNNIVIQFEKILNHPNDELLVSTDGNNILGVLSLLVEPEDMYLEAIGGVFAKDNYEAVAKEFYEYLKSNYKGYQFDAAYPEENEQARKFMESIGAKQLGFDYEMRLNKNQYKSIGEFYNIIPLTEEFYDSFIMLHDKFHSDAYWIGDRLIKSLDKFDVFIALDDAQIVGSIVTSRLKKESEEIYFLYTEEHKENLGYERALMNKAIAHAFNNETDELIIMVDKDNIEAIRLYENFGFKKSDTCLSYTICSLL